MHGNIFIFYSKMTNSRMIVYEIYSVSYTLGGNLFTFDDQN